jgi:hypothetical protein
MMQHMYLLPVVRMHWRQAQRNTQEPGTTR